MTPPTVLARRSRTAGRHRAWVPPRGGPRAQRVPPVGNLCLCHLSVHCTGSRHPCPPQTSAHKHGPSPRELPAVALMPTHPCCGHSCRHGPTAGTTRPLATRVAQIHTGPFGPSAPACLSPRFRSTRLPAPRPAPPSFHPHHCHPHAHTPFIITPLVDWPIGQFNWSIGFAAAVPTRYTTPAGPGRVHDTPKLQALPSCRTPVCAR